MGRLLSSHLGVLCIHLFWKDDKANRERKDEWATMLGQVGKSQCSGCSGLPQPSCESGGVSLAVMVPHTHGAPALKLTLHQLSLSSSDDMLTASPMARGHSQPGVWCFLCHIRGLCAHEGIACGNPCIHTFSPSVGFPKHQTHNVSHLDFRTLMLSLESVKILGELVCIYMYIYIFSFPPLFLFSLHSHTVLVCRQ